MKSTSTALAAHLAGSVTTLATCWRITRLDGTEFFFTDHDRDLSFEGNVYKASSGYSRTAIANDSSLSVDNLDIEGVFDSVAITEEELRAGLFDQAEVRIFLVNWADPSMGSLRMRRGWFGEVTLSEQGIFRTELRGMTQALPQRIGELYSPECRADLGDHRCKVPIHPPEIARDTAYAVGDVVRVRTTGTPVSMALPIVNGGFEADGAGDGAGFTPSGWTKVSGDWDVHDASNGEPVARGREFLPRRRQLGVGGAGADHRLGLVRSRSRADRCGRLSAGCVGEPGELVPRRSGARHRRGPGRGDDRARHHPRHRLRGHRARRQLGPARHLTGPASLGRAEPADPAAASACHWHASRTRPSTPSRRRVTDTTASVPTSADFENRIYRCVTAGTTAPATARVRHDRRRPDHRRHRRVRGAGSVEPCRSRDRRHRSGGLHWPPSTSRARSMAGSPAAC